MQRRVAMRVRVIPVPGRVRTTMATGYSNLTGTPTALLLNVRRFVRDKRRRNPDLVWDSEFEGV